MRKAVLGYQRTLRFESLEDRRVLTGSVHVSGEGGLLSAIDQLGKSNHLVIHQTGGNLANGATIEVQGIDTKLVNDDTGKTGFSFTFRNISDFDIELASGRDSLLFYSTKVTGASQFLVDMGGGSDVLTMNTVRATEGEIDINLGEGNNVAALYNVSSGSDFHLTAGNGHNAIALNTVSSNTNPITENDTFIVELGTGSRNAVAMANCTDGPDGTLQIFNGGEDGVLSGALNNFAHQSDVTTFRFRAGDLKQNKA